jgi:hypothetical protein
MLNLKEDKKNIGEIEAFYDNKISNSSEFSIPSKADLILSRLDFNFFSGLSDAALTFSAAVLSKFSSWLIILYPYKNLRNP